MIVFAPKIVVVVAITLANATAFVVVAITLSVVMVVVVIVVVVMVVIHYDDNHSTAATPALIQIALGKFHTRKMTHKCTSLSPLDLIKSFVLVGKALHNAKTAYFALMWASHCLRSVVAHPHFGSCLENILKATITHAKSVSLNKTSRKYKPSPPSV